MWDIDRNTDRPVRETLSRRGGLRVVAQGLCSELHEDAEQLGLLVDLSEHGLRRKGLGHVTIKDALIGAEQRRLLEAEGVRFSPSGAVELDRYGHRPRSRKMAR